MARCLVDALDYLHNSVNIVHRDIKPCNVLLDESGAPLLVDFGKAVALQTGHVDLTQGNDMTTSIEGTYTFLPPECCSSDGFDFEQKPYSMKKADVWALGVTLYILTYNRFPYELSPMTDGHCTTELDIMEAIANVDVQFSDSERPVSAELKQLLSQMLEKDPERRPDINSIKTFSKFLSEEPAVKRRCLGSGFFSASSLQSEGPK
jgi:serine/threonine protein kinase